MVTKLSSSNCGAHFVESYCKESNISDTNWLRYPFSPYLIKIWLSVWRHHLANLHILKTWIFLEQNEIFENNKQHFSSHADYLFKFSNGFDRKDAIFVIVAFLWSASCNSWSITVMTDHETERFYNTFKTISSRTLILNDDVIWS